MRVQVTVWLLVLHVQPVPLTAVGVNPVGKVSDTVTVVPSVARPPLFVTVSVNVPVPPRMSVDALDVFVITRSGGAAVLTVTDPDADVVSPPPMTLAVFVSEAAAAFATEEVTLIVG